MGQTILWLVWLTGAYPLVRAWRANRRTSLLQAVNWAVVAWAAWGWVLWPGAVGQAPRYAALCLTGCAAVAVLGARRPGVGAWNFVLVGLLAVMLLPLAENWLRPGALQLGLRAVLLGGTIAVGVLNYLPTRFAPAAVLVALGAAAELVALVEMADPPAVGRWLLALAAWVALAGARRRNPPSEFDCLWLGFRDRFGLFWGQRTREQFNRSAANAGWPVYLSWRGLRLDPGAAPPDAEHQEAMVAVLRALLKRFGPE